MAKTVPQLIFEVAQRHGHLPALTFRDGAKWRSLSYRELVGKIGSLAHELQKKGLCPGDRLAIYIDSGVNWLLADLAALASGLVTVPRGLSSPEEELAALIEHSEAKAVTVEKKGLSRLEKVLNLLRHPPQVFVISEKRIPEGTIPPLIPRAEDLATIVYTSGTTGNPKGVMLTQANIVSNVLACQSLLNPQAGKRYLSVLMPYHMLERTVEYLLLASAVEIIFSDKRHFREDLRTFSPHYLVGVPRLWEVFYQRIHQQVSSRGLKTWFHWALKVSLLNRRARKKITGETEAPSFEDGLKGAVVFVLTAFPRLLGEVIFFRKIRRAFGGRIEMAISGGSSLAPELEDFYEAIGIELLNGYGLTETSPVISVRYPGRNVPRTAGPPLPGTTLRLLAKTEGRAEILIRGPQVMKGYWRNPMATRAVFTEDNFLKTGDLGYLTPRGDLVITGRIKDIIVLSSGENVDPEPLEALLFKSPYISQVMLVGQDQKVLGALVVPDRQKLLDWAKEKGLPQDFVLLCQRSEAREFIHQEIKNILSKARIHPYEHVGLVRLIPEEWTLENGLLTFTLKKKRTLIAQRYASQIKDMYS
ncbi:AMP-dependent synthetase/ligase [Thermosulfuriphilus sp.]